MYHFFTRTRPYIARTKLCNPVFRWVSNVQSYSGCGLSWKSVHRGWGRVTRENTCLVPRPYYSARPKRVGWRGPSEHVRPRVRFLGKIQIPIFEFKNRFCVLGSKSKNGSWIHIHTQGGFFVSNPNADFWDWQSEPVFSGKDLKKVFLTSGVSKKKKATQQRTCMTF